MDHLTNVGEANSLHVEAWSANFIGRIELGRYPCECSSGRGTVSISRLWSAFIVERSPAGPSPPPKGSYKRFD